MYKKNIIKLQKNREKAYYKNEKEIQLLCSFSLRLNNKKLYIKIKYQSPMIPKAKTFASNRITSPINNSKIKVYIMIILKSKGENLNKLIIKEDLLLNLNHIFLIAFSVSKAILEREMKNYLKKDKILLLFMII